MRESSGNLKVAENGFVGCTGNGEAEPPLPVEDTDLWSSPDLGEEDGTTRSSGAMGTGVEDEVGLV